MGKGLYGSKAWLNIKPENIKLEMDVHPPSHMVGAWFGPTPTWNMNTCQSTCVRSWRWRYVASVRLSSWATSAASLSSSAAFATASSTRWGEICCTDQRQMVPSSFHGFLFLPSGCSSSRGGCDPWRTGVGWAASSISLFIASDDASRKGKHAKSIEAKTGGWVHALKKRLVLPCQDILCSLFQEGWLISSFHLVELGEPRKIARAC